MATRPATAPVTMPRTLGFPCLIHSITIQVIAAVAVENCVTSMAIPAAPSAATALPALNPNQPTHNIEAPTTVKVKLWGGIGVSGYPIRLPMRRATTRAAIPALI